MTLENKDKSEQSGFVEMFIQQLEKQPIEQAWSAWNATRLSNAENYPYSYFRGVLKKRLIEFVENRVDDALNEL